MTGITQSEMEGLFREYFGAPDKAPLDKKSLDEFLKKIKENTEAMEKSNPWYKKTESLLKGQTRSYQDIGTEMDEFTRRIREAEADVAKYGATEKGVAAQKQLDNLRQSRASRAQVLAQEGLGVATQNTAATMTSAIGTIINGIFNFAENLQRGASGVDTGSQAAIDSVRATAQATQAMGGNLSQFGQYLALLPGPLKAFGAALIGAGQLMEGLAKAQEVVIKAIDFLRNEVNKTTKSYREVFDAGATLGGGLVGLRQQANMAGLGVAQFSAAISKSRDDLVLMGMGMGEAAKQIGGVSRVLRNSQLGDQLTLLGYSFEEQAGLAASLIANQRAAGDERIRSDEEIARMTAEYGKNLRIVSDLTGKDAKKLQDRARLESMRNEVLSRLSAEESVRLQRVLAQTPEQMQRAILQKAMGQVVTDIPFLVAAQQQPALMGFVDNVVGMIKSTMDPEQVTTMMQSEVGRLRDRMRETAASTDQALSFSALMTNNLSGNTKAAADITNQILQQLVYSEKAASAAGANIAETATNTKGLNGEVLALENSTQKMRVALESLMTGPDGQGPLSKFVSVLRTVVGIAEKTLMDSAFNPDGTLKPEVISALQNAGKPPEAAVEGPGKTLGGVAGAYGMGMIGAGMGQALIPIPVVGAAIGGLVGGTIGYFGGGAVGGLADKKAIGGDIFPGKQYLVGERGPELIRPSAFGRVSSTSNSRDFLGQLNSSVNGALLAVQDTQKSVRQISDQVVESTRNSTALNNIDRNFQNDLKNVLQENNMISRQQIGVMAEVRDHIREMTRTQGKIYAVQT